MSRSEPTIELKKESNFEHLGEFERQNELKWLEYDRMLRVERALNTLLVAQNQMLLTEIWKMRSVRAGGEETAGV